MNYIEDRCRDNTATPQPAKGRVLAPRQRRQVGNGSGVPLGKQKAISHDPLGPARRVSSRGRRALIPSSSLQPCRDCPRRRRQHATRSGRKREEENCTARANAGGLSAAATHMSVSRVGEPRPTDPIRRATGQLSGSCAAAADADSRSRTGRDHGHRTYRPASASAQVSILLPVKRGGAVQLSVVDHRFRKTTVARCRRTTTHYHTLWFFFSFFNRNAVRNFFRLTVVDTKYCQIISRV